MDMHSEAAPTRVSWRTHCQSCGSKKAKLWGPGRLTLSKHCPNERCSFHGLPQLFSVKTIVTIDRLGRRHVSHREFTVKRRPTIELRPPTGP